MRRIRLLGVTAIVAVTLSGCDRGTTPESTVVPAASELVRTALGEVHDGTASPSRLVVAYDDLHPFHGGETLTIRNGRLEVRYLPRGATAEQVEPPSTSLPEGAVADLVDLLISIEAWEQRVPEREPFPDESRAYLTVTVGEASTTIWEWYNDLSGNDRVVRVKAFLEALAPPPPTGGS